MGISKKVFATAYRTQSDLGFDSTLPVDAFQVRSRECANVVVSLPRTRVLPKGHYFTALTQGALGECLTTQKRYAEAEPILQDSYSTSKNVQGEKSPLTLEAVRRLVTLYQSWGKSVEAARYQAALPQTTAAQTESHTP